MIRDLEEEVVAIRNLVEKLAYSMGFVLSGRLGEDDDTTETEGHQKALQEGNEAYYQHRCDRFDKETEDAEAVLTKATCCAGDEYYSGLNFVPREWSEDFKRLFEGAFALAKSQGNLTDDQVWGLLSKAQEESQKEENQ